MSNESKQNSGSITPLLSNCTPDNGATENNKVMTPKSRSHSWLVTNVTLCRPLWGCPKRDNSEHSHLTCITHVRHVSPKRVMHTFCYSTYAFEKNIAYEKRGSKLIPALLRGGVQSSSMIGVRHWFSKLQKRIIHILVPKLKQHIDT
jgi:hypothetical protein